jgi:Ca2+-binding RTX toxin-like protein
VYSTSYSIYNINTKLLLVILGLTFFFLGLFPVLSLVDVYGDSSGITKLKKLGNKIGDLDFNSGAFFGNVETCSDLSSCVGTKKDDIIYGGLRSQVFALDGNDMIYGGADSFLFGGKDDDLILGGAGKALIDGGNGDDVMLGGLGNQLIVGGKGNDKLFGGTGDSVMDGGTGANHFDCPISLLGLARAVVLDYNPDNGDTIAGQCKIVNTEGNTRSDDIPDIDFFN